MMSVGGLLIFLPLAVSSYVDKPLNSLKSVRRQTYGYLPSRRAWTSTPTGRYQIYCSMTEAHVSEQLAEGCYLKAGQTRDLPVASHTENHNTAVGIYVTRRTLLVDYDIPRARWRPAVGRKFDDAERGLTASMAPCITAPAARYQASQTAQRERESASPRRV